MGKKKQSPISQTNTNNTTPESKRVDVLRKRINRRDLETEQIKYYTPYKKWTYGWLFAFTPYGLYRVYQKDTEFVYHEKLILSMVAIVYLVSLFLNVFGGMAFW